MTPLTIALAGSTHRTQLIAESLHRHPSLKISWVLTPAPKAVGRKQEIVMNPLHRWAESQRIPSILIEKNKLDQEIKTQCELHERPDILFVVDFGYYVPGWLLQLPRIAPLNFHPSALPKWRGSSPGQFVLLAGDTTSAVSVIIINQYLDQGAIVYQESFAVQPSWNHSDYYAFSYALLAPKLPQILLDFATDPAKTQPQPIDSPTPTARRLEKTDSFVPWEILERAMYPTEPQNNLPFTLPTEIETSPVLETLLASNTLATHPRIIEHAHRAFAPWPMMWTKIPTQKGTKRMQILRCSIGQNNNLVLETVKIEGLPEKPWNEIKNQLIKNNEK